MPMERSLLWHFFIPFLSLSVPLWNNNSSEMNVKTNSVNANLCVVVSDVP